MKTNISTFLHSLSKSPVIPVLSLHKQEHALPVAEALAEGGLTVIEITLRTDAALPAINRIAQTMPEITVGAGTVINPQQFDLALEHGSQFIVSPGSSEALLRHGQTQPVPYLPGIQTVSELMTGIEAGYELFKFFPAASSGGITAINALQALFNDVKFCPTGGITAENAADYLALNNVACVGGTWLAPQALIDAGDWKGITRLASTAVSRVKDLRD